MPIAPASVGGRSRLWTVKRAALLLGTAALASAALAACGDDDDDETAAGAGEVLSVVLDEYNFAFSGEPISDTLTIKIENVGEEIHELAMGRLEEGKTIDDVRAALAAAGEEEPDLDSVFEGGDEEPIDDLGGAHFPGSELSVTGSGITPGDYVAMCFVPSSDGKPHHELGMIEEFTIGEGEAADEPEPDATYTVTEDGLDGPDSLDAGVTVVHLVNDSTINREIQVGKLADGKTFKEAGEFFEQFDEGPPTAEGLADSDNPIAFFSFIFDAEQDRFVTLDLTPGTWLIGMPDPENPFEGEPDKDPNAVVIEVT